MGKHNDMYGIDDIDHSDGLDANIFIIWIKDSIVWD